MDKLPEHTYAQLNSDGHMEIINMLSGKVIAVQKDRQSLLIGDTLRAREVTLETGDRIWVEKTIGPEGVTLQSYKYSELEAEAIACLIADGESLRSISKKPGFPPLQVIRKWRQEHPEFESRISLAKKDRAEMYMDFAIASAEDCTTKEDAPAAKVKFEAYKWAATVDDSDTFGSKTKISGDPNAPLILQIDTGIRREASSPGNTMKVLESIAVKAIPELQNGKEDFMGEEVPFIPNTGDF